MLNKTKNRIKAALATAGFAVWYGLCITWMGSHNELAAMAFVIYTSIICIALVYYFVKSVIFWDDK